MRSSTQEAIPECCFQFISPVNIFCIIAFAASKQVPKSTLICALTPNPCKEYHHKRHSARSAYNEEIP